MKFSDLKFEEHWLGGGVRAELQFPNGWGVSVIRCPGSYGYEEGLYELAVLKDGDLNYDNPVAKGDVRGYLTEAGVEELGSMVERFPRRLTPFYLCTEWVRRSRSWLGKRLRAAVARLLRRNGRVSWGGQSS
jgi:hypothetical protein